MASSSMMTEVIIGKKIEDVEEIFEKFHSMLTEDEGDYEELGKLDMALKEDFNMYKLKRNGNEFGSRI